ncbi:hypothetical protein AURANDRAFT_62222 [Aureococcus anophagefferens]|uniref:SH3 domain-containing protein n=1 Tax=Aureococcus anophagefferens TaxID=44056 RepID=F0Y2T1_AURAN|nr:hypothetical protein AURANDRAFT_62222 [Aureococcus anophagefferens]EGB10753.1 hypothetical protein AURANDRAFT_62222 [Aureococcus anophagefferens]|eukprot:XP_009034342.1 hypothetical protein AURANDRAFT_62222 [Aureococcus anophagefferens]
MAFLCELRRALRFVEEKPKARHSASLPATKVEATLVSEAVLEARYERLRADLRRRDEASSRDLEEREAASLRFDEEIYKLRAKNLANLEETERAIAKLKVDAAASLAEAEALERDAEEAWGDVGAPPADGARQPSPAGDALDRLRALDLCSERKPSPAAPRAAAPPPPPRGGPDGRSAMDVLRALDRAALDDDSGDSSDASSEGSAPPPPPLTPPPLHCMPAAHLSFDRSPSPPPPPDDEGAPHPPPDDEGEPRPPPDDELDGIVFESIDEYHESHAREPPPPRAPPVALPPKRRTSDFFERLCPTHGAPYYESAATGESSWDHPAAGVVERVDADSGHAYFLDAATGRTAWAIEDLYGSALPGATQLVGPRASSKFAARAIRGAAREVLSAMNFIKRTSITAKHMYKHKTFGGGGSEEVKDEAHEAAMAAQEDYEKRVKTLVAMTMDARAQLAEVFLQLGHGAQCAVELAGAEVDVGLAGQAIGLQGSAEPDPARLQALLNGTTRAKVTAGMMQEAFHGSFGEGLQEALLTPLESELELFEKTKEAVAKKLEAALDAQHYAQKVRKLSESGKDKDKDKLESNSAKAAAATKADDEARAALDAALGAHDAARLELLSRRVGELKGMLHRFCERVLEALAAPDMEIGRRADAVELDRYNIYGDVNVESAMAKLQKNMNAFTLKSRSSTESVSMRMAHMQKHAKTTFLNKKPDGDDAATEDPLELEVNEMAKRYDKAFDLLAKLRGALAALHAWYDGGFSAFVGVAGELAGLVKDGDGGGAAAAVLQFHASLEEVRGFLGSALREPLEGQLLGALDAGLDQYRPLATALKEREARALERAHYKAKVATLEGQTAALHANDKSTDKAKAAHDERVARNRAKAFETDEQARADSTACRDQLLAFDVFFKNSVMNLCDRLPALQRDFYVQFGATVVGAMKLDASVASVQDTAAAAKLEALMAAGVVVPNAGMTLDPGAAAQAVTAQFDFAEVQAGDLGFKVGDLILTDEAAFNAAGASGGWITGELNGKSGSFPSNYVAP